MRWAAARQQEEAAPDPGADRRGPVAAPATGLVQEPEVGDLQEPRADGPTPRIEPSRIPPDGHEDVLHEVLRGGAVDRLRGETKDRSREAAPGIAIRKPGSHEEARTAGTGKTARKAPPPKTPAEAAHAAAMRDDAKSRPKGWVNSTVEVSIGRWHCRRC